LAKAEAVHTVSPNFSTDPAPRPKPRFRQTGCKINTLIEKTRIIPEKYFIIPPKNEKGIEFLQK